MSLNKDRLVYVLVADKKIKYGNRRSRIVYIGTTKKGLARIATSVSYRANTILTMHGVYSFEARILLCRPRKHVKTWHKLERALLLSFKSQYGVLPVCNSHGKGIKETNEFTLFSRSGIQHHIEDLS